MRVNVRSLYVLPRRHAAHGGGGGGSIVNISSHGAAHETTPFMPPGYLVYSVAKAALERSRQRQAALELRPLGISINALRPGAVKTEMTALEFGPDADWSGWATPGSVVPPVAALAAHAGGAFTGHILDVAGFGRTWS